jgi:hypothetical protein
MAGIVHLRIVIAVFLVGGIAALMPYALSLFSEDVTPSPFGWVGLGGWPIRPFHQFAGGRIGDPILCELALVSASDKRAALANSEIVVEIPYATGTSG